MSAASSWKKSGQLLHLQPGRVGQDGVPLAKRPESLPVLRRRAGGRQPRHERRRAGLKRGVLNGPHDLKTGENFVRMPRYGG